MSYQSISVKEAVNKVNASFSGWYLPAVQRPYVWGSRYESEKYICKLFDSILRGYPIGGIIIWNTGESVPHREFLGNYKIGDMPEFVDKGLWERADKGLVYDGQQRLQTLYSCLKYTLNSKVLVFDLLFNLESSDNEPDDTGFSFIGKNETPSGALIRMNEVFVKHPDDRSKYRRHLIDDKFKVLKLDEKQEDLIESNLDKLWDIFVKTDTKSLAYFPIDNKSEDMVNEIFQRLNTGGIPLSLSDLLMSIIKEAHFDFEERLQCLSKQIYSSTGKGFIYDQYSILQVINLIVKGTTRVDPKKVKNSEVERYNKILDEIIEPLKEFFIDFIWGQFKINNSAIVPKKMALIPLVIYFYVMHKKGSNFRKMSINEISILKKYFILSQINDWNIQTIADRFSKIILEQIDSDLPLYFPLKEMIEWLNENKKRQTLVYESVFVDYQWFALKLLTPTRVYQFDPDDRGRFNPEIDHIFPLNLESKSNDDSYKREVDIVWNMQPVKGDVNNYKRRKHPKDFFSGDGSKYFSDYDFIPTDLSSHLWEDPLEFIKVRKALMKKFIKDTYGIDLV